MRNIIFSIIRFRRIRFVLTCCVFVFFYATLVTYVKIETITGDDKMFVKTEFDDISCYFKNVGDVLPSAEGPWFSPNDKSIFFIDSTCIEQLTMTQACVAESAARSNPQWDIYVLFSFPITDLLSKRFLAELLKYPNVHFARIHIAEFAKGTAVESILVNEIKKSKHPMEDTSHILKIVTLHKWGGIFVDSDMLVIRPFEELPANWVSKLAKGVSTGILSFAKDGVGRNITSEILKELAMTYDPKSRHFNLLKAILIRVLKRICPGVTSIPGQCNGIEVFPEDFFYPLKIPIPEPYLDEPGIEVDEIPMPYTYPLRSMDFSSYLSEENSSYASLARIFCPRLYKYKLSLIAPHIIKRN